MAENITAIIDELHQLNISSLVGDIDVDQLDILLNSYLGSCRLLAYTSPEEIRRTQRVLGRSIAIYASRKSPVYANRIDVSLLNREDCLDAISGDFLVSKFDLMDKDLWYTDDFASTENSTSGTTGSPFRYKIWNDAFTPIEKEMHYGSLLEEFGITGDIGVLNMVSGQAAKGYRTVNHGQAKIQVAQGDEIANYVARIHCGHGSSEARMHSMVFDEAAYFHIKDYCNFVVQYCQENKIDVLLGSGGLFELLCTHFITNEPSGFPRLCQVLSNTGDRANLDTLEFLIEVGIASDWCDHMRCWDGGVSFFTCKHHTYHLMDELSYVYSDSENRMRSVDFFSYPSPFINYWNGDYAQVADEYKKCQCGRWYRPFKFLSRRPRSNRSGGGYYDSQKVHHHLSQQYDVKFVSYQDNFISVEDSTLTEETKAGIVSDMAKERIAVQFFTQKNLRAFSSSGKATTP